MSRCWDPIDWLMDSQRCRRSWTRSRRTAIRSSQMWWRPTQEWRTAGVTAWWILRPCYWQFLDIRRAPHNAKSWLYKHTVTFTHCWRLQTPSKKLIVSSSPSTLLPMLPTMLYSASVSNSVSLLKASIITTAHFTILTEICRRIFQLHAEDAIFSWC